MRRFLTVVASVFVILVLLAPYADAQQTTAAGPSPKVTINGVIDNVTSWSKNMSLADTNTSRVDKEWYARTRARPDITGELGTTKFVLGLELDYTWGQSCTSDDAFHRCAIGSTGTGAPMTTFGLHNGASAGGDINTDFPGVLEIKWAYTEFALPWAPAGSIMRLGAQPFTVTHKLAVLATGDFAGVHTSIVLTPAIKVNLTYAQIEEANTGVSDGFFRGDDFAFIASVDVSPFKGLDLRPLYAYTYINGATSSSTRQSRGGLSAGTATFPTGGFGTLTPGQGNTAPPTANFASVLANGGSAIEQRHTIGLDAKWTLGPFYVDPTIFYQWGHRDFVVPTGVAVPCTSPAAPAAGNVPGCVGTTTIASGFTRAGSLQNQDMKAYLIDVASGWRSGPLLLEVRGSYTSGNKATDDIRDARQTARFFQPITTDAQFWAGWAEIQTVGIDYFNMVTGADTQRGLAPGFAVGYDKYGLIRAGARASYALTPAFTVRASVVPTWTAEKVDTAGIKTGTNGIIPGNIGRANRDGDSRTLGTEIDAGITWRFAPGLTFDLVGGYMFLGDGYKAALATASAGTQPLNTQQVGGAAGGTSININRPDTNPKDVSTVAARVRYSF